MKREELPGFVRELPITILTLILVFGVVFYPLYSRWWRKAKEKQAEETQEMTVSAEETTEGVSE